ncbi:hypothetical protein CLF_100622 [Clonorchis sinensis]|uniref:Uncharacterized protein n=1 Tax=Clonorchis sinensis TaxID=79923 RepID=G7Y3V7_CLOSI|nr:hypothetical protein CLF_100622 [Clonorchis sinensis]
MRQYRSRTDQPDERIVDGKFNSSVTVESKKYEPRRNTDYDRTHQNPRLPTLGIHYRNNYLRIGEHARYRIESENSEFSSCVIDSLLDRDLYNSRRMIYFVWNNGQFDVMCGINKQEPPLAQLLEHPSTKCETSGLNKHPEQRTQGQTVWASLDSCITQIHVVREIRQKIHNANFDGYLNQISVNRMSAHTFVAFVSTDRQGTSAEKPVFRLYSVRVIV